jgi:uncharacterized protein (DUF2237 family)
MSGSFWGASSSADEKNILTATPVASFGRNGRCHIGRRKLGLKWCMCSIWFNRKIGYPLQQTDHCVCSYGIGF